MRSTQYVPYVPYVLAFVATCATAACTAVLGNYEVTGESPGGGPAEGGPILEGGGGPPVVEGGVDVFVPTDAPADSPPSCKAPQTACGASCVDMETDKDNCGSCGRSCLGGMCAAHVCSAFLVYARTDVAANTLVATNTDLFFSIAGKDLVQQSLTAGVAAVTLAMPSGEIFAIAPAAPNVYFTAQNADGTTWDYWTATIGMAFSGSAAGFSIGGNSVGLVAAGGYVHTANVLPGTPASFRIVSCPPPNGACGANFSGPGIPGSRMAAGGMNIFWTDELTGGVYAMPESIGLRTTIGGAEGTATAANWDGTSLFWVQNNTGVLRRSPYPMPAPVDVRDLTSSANDMIVDGTNVYYSQFSGGANQLFSMPKSGAVAPTRIASSAGISRLAQTASAIYWAESDGIHVVRKP